MLLERRYAQHEYPDLGFLPISLDACLPFSASPASSFSSSSSGSKEERDRVNHREKVKNDKGHNDSICHKERRHRQREEHQEDGKKENENMKIIYSLMFVVLQEDIRKYKC